MVFFFWFQIITSEIHWIFRKGRNLGNYLENPLVLRTYKGIQEWLGHLSKLIKLDAKVAIETRFPRFRWTFTELPGKWKYLLCSAKLDCYLFHRADHIPPHIHCPVSLFYQVYWIPWRFNPGMSVLLTLYSHIWLTLYQCHSFSLETFSLLPHDFPNIFQISVKNTSPKQPFLILTQLSAPCYVHIWHSVLFPLDMCPNCGATCNFEIYLFLFFY